MAILPRVYVSQTMQSSMRRQRQMRKARTEVVLGEGDDCACDASIDQVTLLFLVSSLRDTLYLLLKGSVRMFLLLS